MFISYDMGAQGQRKTSDTEADRAQKRFAVETSQAKAVARNAPRMPPISRYLTA